MTATMQAPTATLAETYQRARDLYASAPSHAGANSLPAPGTYCVVTALSAHMLPLEPLKQFLGVPQLFQWNAVKSTATVLDAWDRYIASLDRAA